jgi:hypothetical protein
MNFSIMSPSSFRKNTETILQIARISFAKRFCVNDFEKIIVIIIIKNTDKTTVIFFTRKTDSIRFNHELCNILTGSPNCVKVIGILL